MSSRFSNRVTQLLHSAGWYEGRTVQNAEAACPDLAPFAAAQIVLREFGGLHIGDCGPGIECATSDVEINPASASHLGDEIFCFERSMGFKLFVLGEVHRRHGYLVIDEFGRTYLLSDVLQPLALSFSDCLERLLLGFLPIEDFR